MNKTFAGIEKRYSDEATSKIVLQSIPYDGTSTWGKGADRGFEAFLDAAENMELYDIETDSEVYKNGIYMPDSWKSFSSPEAMFHSVYKNTKALLENGKFNTFFGGEHSISIGVIKAYYEKYKNLSVLHIDAHADLRAEYAGTKYNHACAVHTASQNCKLVQVGIRSMDISEKEHMDYENVYFAEAMQDNDDWMSEAVSKLTDEVYITLDLDAFDPGIMPATGTPEPGGLSWYQMIQFLKKVFGKVNVVGFDIVELAPIDGMSVPQFLAAKLYYKMLSYKFNNYEKR